MIHSSKTNIFVVSRFILYLNDTYIIFSCFCECIVYRQVISVACQRKKLYIDAKVFPWKNLTWYSSQKKINSCLDLYEITCGICSEASVSRICKKFCLKQKTKRSRKKKKAEELPALIVQRSQEFGSSKYTKQRVVDNCRNVFEFGELLQVKE